MTALPYIELPSAEKEVSALLRAQAQVQAAVADRVYTVMPKTQTFPLILVQLINSRPKWMTPYWFDLAALQISVYADSKPLAARIAEIARATAATWDGSVLGVDGYVSSIESATLFWNPDDGWQPSKPRYTFDLETQIRPVVGSPSP